MGSNSREAHDTVLVRVDKKKSKKGTPPAFLLKRLNKTSFSFSGNDQDFYASLPGDIKSDPGTAKKAASTSVEQPSAEVGYFPQGGEFRQPDLCIAPDGKSWYLAGARESVHGSPPGSEDQLWFSKSADQGKTGWRDPP